MMIQGEFFQIIPSGEHSLHFDLKLLHKIGGNNPREEYKDAGFGMSLDTAIKKCINYAINQRYDVLSLREYLNEYRKIKKELDIQLDN